MRMSEQYKVADFLPEGSEGPWLVQRFAVSEADEQFGRLRAAISSCRGRYVPAGIYTRLLHGETMIMSDTPDEVRDHIELIVKAKGRVLLHGLGLGMVARAALLKPEVEHVTIIEKAPEVVKLVGEPLIARFGAERTAVITDDAFTWKPPKGVRWDVVWHDIWPTLCSDNLPEMAQLHRRFGHRAGWQGSWGRSWCEMYRKERG